jgi:hypothetical protein
VAIVEYYTFWLPKQRPLQRSSPVPLLKLPSHLYGVSTYDEYFVLGILIFAEDFEIFCQIWLELSLESNDVFLHLDMAPFVFLITVRSSVSPLPYDKSVSNRKQKRYACKAAASMYRFNSSSRWVVIGSERTGGVSGLFCTGGRGTGGIGACIMKNKYNCF